MKIDWKLNLKLRYFEYFVLMLLKKLRDRGDDIYNNKLSPIVIQKILFLTVCTDIEDGDEILIDSVFDNWYATPYGHLELDIEEYRKETDGRFSHFTMSKDKLVIDPKLDIDYTFKMLQTYIQNAN